MEATDAAGSGGHPRSHDRLLPFANVARIMKSAVPPPAKISKDAKETMQECVSEFISFIASEASDQCESEKRSVMKGEDVVWAMQRLGLEEYAEAMRVYLASYREAAKAACGDPPALDRSATLTSEDAVAIAPTPLNAAPASFHSSLTANVLAPTISQISASQQTSFLPFVSQQDSASRARFFGETSPFAQHDDRQGLQTQTAAPVFVPFQRNATQVGQASFEVMFGLHNAGAS